MYIDNFREIIKSDLFNIGGRLKQIDKNYFIVRNHQTAEFEVHYKGQIGGTFALSIPYDKLDERTLKRVRETSIEYAQNIFSEMERNNAKLEADQDRKRKDVTETVTKDIYRYLNKHESKETIDADSQYFKEVI
jgi:NH3-dependent NAD+ synthetase